MELKFSNSVIKGQLVGALGIYFQIANPYQFYSFNVYQIGIN